MSACRSLLPYDRSLLPYEGSLLPFDALQAALGTGVHIGIAIPAVYIQRYS